MSKIHYELYQITPDVSGKGLFYFTECGNKMYSTGNDPLTYNGKLCPKCLNEGKVKMLILAGTPKAKELLKLRGF